VATVLDLAARTRKEVTPVPVKQVVAADLRAQGGMAALEPSEPIVPTLSDYSRTWLKNLEFERKPSTTGSYAQCLQLYVMPKFGAVGLDRI